MIENKFPQHPCYVGEGRFDHEWEYKDDSFDHEYGCEVIQYLECIDCGQQADIDLYEFYGER